MKQFYSILLISLLPIFHACADDFEPWSVAENHPVIIEDKTSGDSETLAKSLTAAEKKREELSLSFVLLAFYQENLSDMLTGRCPMHPSCSRYSVEAISRFGPLKGIPMSVDRLIHEGEAQRHCPLIQTENGLRYDDPIEDNLFRW